MPLEMLMGCRDDGGFSFQLCGVKQEQDLFLRFSIKKAVDSLEKVAIGSTGLRQIARMSRLKILS